MDGPGLVERPAGWRLGQLHLDQQRSQAGGVPEEQGGKECGGTGHSCARVGVRAGVLICAVPRAVLQGEDRL